MTTELPPASIGKPLDPEILGDIDAWNVSQADGWYFFEADLPNTDGVRGYRREVAGGAILAQTPGAVLGFLALGGSRVARSTPGVGAFPHHVVAPNDEVGAVGVAGLEEVTLQSAAECLTESPQIAETAHAFLAKRREARLGLPLIVARAEYDDSTSVQSLKSGRAIQNLITASKSIIQIASGLEKRASTLAVSLEFVLEDVTGRASRWASGMNGVMERLSSGFYEAGFARTYFFGVMDNTDAKRIDAQFQFAQYSGDFNMTWVAPSYAFARDSHYRLTQTGQSDRARAEADALAVLLKGETWVCPTILLAELEPDGQSIRVITNAERPLEIDTSDPFSAGETAGFHIDGVKIKSVDVARNCDRDILIKFSGSLKAGARLDYAVGTAGALREANSKEHGAGRWALPARALIGLNTGSDEVSSSGICFSAAQGWTEEGRVLTSWTSEEGAAIAYPAKPNAGEVQVGLGLGALDVLELQPRINCGFTAPNIAQGDTFSFAVLFCSPSQNAGTLVSMMPEKGKNYLFLAENDGQVRLQYNDESDHINVPLDGAGPHLVVASVQGEQMSLRVNGGDLHKLTATLEADTGARDLFIGCRSNRSGLVKTLGDAQVASVWIWPDENILTDENASYDAVFTQYEELLDGL